ncbi:MAG: 50S ribosomal protein L11 methyltransferase [Acidobacteriaceae bacterium]|nr:50S ribosomal protein L11 methyltransferase [Acidobacteriaceae bacterium]
MYSLRVTCSREISEIVSADLWEAGTLAIGEFENSDAVILIAGFATNERREQLLTEFACYSPEWHAEATDWVRKTKEAWPPREVGRRIFLAPYWSTDPTPPSRVRIIHNPGLACGTGEHPCTQLAIEALEQTVRAGMRVADIGTGSGLLAITALRLGAASATAVDADFEALVAARQNFSLNGLSAALVNGSADCLESALFDITVANISGTVLLAILDDLRRITKSGGQLILTGFPAAEMPVLQDEIGNADVSTREGWCCLTASVSSAPVS